MTRYENKVFSVLDVSAGRRNVWIDRRRDDVVWLDIRQEVNPTVVADSRALPFRDGSFDLVVFDPPHTNVGATGHMSRLYGHHTAAEIRTIVVGTGREIARVLRPNGLVAFKWSDHGHVSRDRVLAWMPHLEPLFGHLVKAVLTGHRSSTWWVLLRRREDFAAADEMWRIVA